MREVREGIRIIDNVTVILTDECTGKQRIFRSHNASLNYALWAIAQWIGWKNNFGYQPVVPPSYVQLGSGSGTPGHADPGLFAPIAGAIGNMSYVEPNVPSNGTTTFVFQVPAGLATIQVTEALMLDSDGHGWYHTMFPVPFTPSATENITIQWETTFSS